MPARVPVIDVGPLCLDEQASDLGRVVAQLAEASRHPGVFHIVRHGVPDELIRRVWMETKRFFALPRAVKRSVSRPKENSRGYYDRELTKNARDQKEVFDFGNVPFPDLPPPHDHPDNQSAVGDQNQWLPDAPKFRQTMEEYFKACETLGLKLLSAYCLGLDLPEHLLHPHFTGDHTSFVRLNYYPLGDPLDPADSATVTPLGDMALHHHTDAGALTILLQDDVGGLQAFAGGEWLDVEPLDGALVINTGDVMQVWSNDLYKAALHRVLPRTERERYSIPFFFNPSYDTDYAPLETVIGDGPKYRTINWGEFRRLRADGDYADYGKEVQIEDFRIG